MAVLSNTDIESIGKNDKLSYYQEYFPGSANSVSFHGEFVFTQLGEDATMCSIQNSLKLYAEDEV